MELASPISSSFLEAFSRLSLERYSFLSIATSTIPSAAFLTTGFSSFNTSRAKLNASSMISGSLVLTTISFSTLRAETFFFSDFPFRMFLIQENIILATLIILAPRVATPSAAYSFIGSGLFSTIPINISESLVLISSGNSMKVTMAFIVSTACKTTVSSLSSNSLIRSGITSFTSSIPSSFFIASFFIMYRVPFFIKGSFSCNAFLSIDILFSLSSSTIWRAFLTLHPFKFSIYSS
ncbi:236aa long hypothetical protein [Pyrococcus horikoshii OT3]|uniref:Uncharacterized protein n=1 Tax=Pyrococcus horikoshii (strain ATCC 700860 / DSM 12428 / JCM 9974 / NBRC 100139 / OT-3) TaxID=70601 RepID=O59192_PYRHO|nr:236aa long hypothetical protein [Pyrococcus horikoshii OT3]